MHFHPRLAPIKAAIFPLVNKEGMDVLTRPIYRDLKADFNVFYDDKEAVGRHTAARTRPALRIASPSMARRCRIKP